MSTSEIIGPREVNLKKESSVIDCYRQHILSVENKEKYLSIDFFIG